MDYSPLDTDEPEDDWETAQESFAQPLITLTLCRYSGQPYREYGCEVRQEFRHPDEDCWEHFHSASAIVEGVVEEMPFVVREVRYGADGATGAAL